MGGGGKSRFLESININWVYIPPLFNMLFRVICHSKLPKMSLQIVTPNVTPTLKIANFTHKKRR